MSKKLYRDLQIILEKKAKELLDTNDKEDLKQLESILDVATQQLQSGQTESKIGALNWISLLFTLVMPVRYSLFAFSITRYTFCVSWAQYAKLIKSSLPIRWRLKSDFFLAIDQ